jgi:cytochrome c551/c552
MNKLIFRIFIIALFPAGVANADANLGLATERQCTNCHALTADSGHAPSFKAIARKYRTHDHAEAILVETVMKGNPVTGGYHWALMPEPGPTSRSPVTEPEARQLVQWILRMK